MGNTSKRRHHLEGIVHEGTFDGHLIRTTWTTTRKDANDKAEEFRKAGADLARVFTDGRSGFRIVGHFYKGKKS